MCKVDGFTAAIKNIDIPGHIKIAYQIFITTIVHTTDVHCIINHL